MWLSMIETQLNIEINLKDMANLQNLIKKNQVAKFQIWYNIINHRCYRNITLKVLCH